MTFIATFGLIHFSIRLMQPPPVLPIWPTPIVTMALPIALPPVCWIQVDKPEEYSVEAMTSLAEDIERVSEEEASSSDQQGNPADQDESQQVPNVIMVQLESFIDLTGWRALPIRKILCLFY